MVVFDQFGPVVAEIAEPQTPLWQTLAVVAFFGGLIVTLGHTVVGIL